jgi:hypothetical protein
VRAVPTSFSRVVTALWNSSRACTLDIGRIKRKSISAAEMMERIAEASPCPKARIAGALFLLLLLTAACTEFFFHGRLSFAADLAAGMVHDRCDAAFL